MLSFDLLPLSSLFLGTFALYMTKYRIKVTEVLSRFVEMEAESEADAIEIVRRMYRDYDIILDASDYVETEFSVKK